MFDAELTLQPLHRAICLFFAAVIVSSSLMLGAAGVESMEQDARAALLA